MSGVYTLSIGALARATGVPVNTLRTWERRYGFPRSTRLPSGHRRYGQQQVLHIRWAQRALELGYKPSSLHSLDTDALQSLVRTHESPGPVRIVGPCSRIQAWLTHVDRLDMVALEKELLKAWSRHGAIGMFDLVVKPFMVEVGMGWQVGRFTVAQEHAVSECLSDFLATRWRQMATGATGPAVILAALPNQQHVLGLQQVAVVLSMYGYRVHFLGRGAPLSALVETVAQVRPVAMMLSIPVTNVPVQTTAQILELRSRISQDVQLVIGGRDAPRQLVGVQTLDSMSALNDWAQRERVRSAA